MILVLDTATRTPVVIVARPDGTPVAERRWTSRHRHGEELLQRIDEAMGEADVSRSELSAVVVGTGPGSFTGLRIGLATAKTIAYSLGIPIIGLSTTAALAHASGAEGEVIVTLPAGASDRYIHRLGGRKSQPQVRGGLDVEADAIAVDFEASKVPAAALERGEAALSQLGIALASLGAKALAAGATDDVEQLVPAYVALPRGIARAAAEMAWSPDLR
jgi:tRNA threonylcarbamoyl adenosine modification protein YeaZ